MFTQLTVSQSWFQAFFYDIPMYSANVFSHISQIISIAVGKKQNAGVAASFSKLLLPKCLPQKHCCPILLKFLVTYQALMVSSTNIATLQLTAGTLQSLHIKLFCSYTKRMRMIKQTTDSFQKFFIFPPILFFLIKSELQQINTSITTSLIKIASWETWRF